MRLNAMRQISFQLEKLSRFPALGRFVPNPTWREGKWHLDLVVSLASILRPQNYLEVGIYRCGLFNRMVPYCKTLTGIDIDSDAGKYMKKSPNVTFLPMSSREFWQSTSDSTYDFIMIDANHSKESVEEDFYNGLKFLKDDGILMLHDTYPESQEATSPDRCDDGFLFVGEASMNSKTYEMMTLPKHPGLTLCRKRTSQVLWM
jgi:predicted O-methyltransferase YrrM